MTKGMMQESIVKMVIADFLPFHFFQKSEGFKALNGDLAAKLKVSI